MGIIELLLLAVALAMDALAVAVGLSLKFRWDSARQFFRLSFHFGFFQFMMPVLGWAAGASFERWIKPYDHWVALLLLGFIGIKMIREALHSSPEQRRMTDPTRGRMLVLLSVATSIDALAVGVSLSMVIPSIWFPSLIIGCVAALFTLAGMRFGNRIGAGRAEILEVTGGLILIGIGLKIFFSL